MHDLYSSLQSIPQNSVLSENMIYLDVDKEVPWVSTAISNSQ